MAKKKIQNHDENDGDGEKKQKASDLNMVVLKIDLHCEGCAGRVVKAVRTLDGVESVKVGDTELNKLTVIGDLDPVKLRRKIEEKTKKKVEVISPATKKTNDGDNTTQSGGGGNKKKQQNPPENDQKPPAKTAGKPKELPVTTGVLKVSLHCQGCIRQIHKFVTKTKGYLEMSVDKNKDLVTVKGAIDMKLLAEALQQKLKRTVEIVPAKKDGDGEKKGSGGGGGKKGKGGNGGGNGGDGEDSGGGGEKGKNKSGGGGGGGGRPEIYRMENYGGPVGYPYPQYAYGPGFGEYVHAPQLFSDENPNACVIM